MIPLASVDWHALFFWLFALATCGFAVAVLFSANVVRMAFYLVLSLGASAGLFFLTGAEFVAAMQLMIYVGGTLVLLVFGVMLTAQSRFVSLKTPPGEWILALIAGSALLSVLLAAAVKVPAWKVANPDRQAVAAAETQATTQLGMGLAGVRVDRLEQADPELRRGMSGYLLPFVIVSIHLLVVLIGAAYMARAKRRAVTVDEGTV
jgi:NADH-quinone oxidoreductase subunit J